MNIKSLLPVVSAPKKRRVTFLTAALVSLLASNPVQALPTSFPQYPLQTGFATTVPPNVMLILDDSGSMSWTVMPVNKTWTNYNGNNRYPKNPNNGYDTPYYRSYINNVIYYDPSVTYKPWRTASLPPSEDRLPPANLQSVSDHASDLSGSLDLRGNGNTHFFVPKPGISNPGTNYNNYYKYRIAASNAAGSHNGAIVQRCAQLNCTSPAQWSNAITETPTGRSQQEELQNFANWFHYHSTRMKMAKAGASEAFGQLDENFRVGYDRINSNTNARTNGVDKIVYRIPYTINNGLFEGQNRTDFFNHLHNQNAAGGTPLRLALTRTGEYYKTIDPYKNSNGTPLSCRKNFAILTTDGEWNGNNPAQPMAFPNLASIGNYYWKTDLRSDLVNNVPTTPSDTAKWQHMNTFGISIGAGSTLSSAPKPTGGPWPRVSANQGTKNIDDLAWAAGEGRGQFFLANNTNEFAKALTEALASIGDRDASVTNTTSASNKLKDGLFNFTTLFNSGTWLGDVIAVSLKIKSGVPASFDGGWKLSDTFGTQGVNKDFSQRTVLTSHGGTAKLFTSSTITDAVFARSGGADAVTVADNINYLRGVSTLEGTLRVRDIAENKKSPIGDIVNGSPFYALDSETLFVGANDGMLHAIDSKDGKVLFSYVPKGLDFAAMASLSSTRYEHRFFVDGSIDVSTTKITQDKNILIAALGRGGRGIFALDVTDPTVMGTAQVLWDETTQDTTTNENMGYVLGRLRIRQGNGDKTWALVPNGIESPSGKSVLFAYELDTDGKIAETHELIADNGSNNGLMSLGMADINGDGRIDIVYGGDLKGNLWRWDFSTETPGEATLLFNTGGQPITAGITNARNPVTEEIFVGFGTGRFLNEDDLPQEAPQMQSIYGIIDSTTTINRNDLQDRYIEFHGEKNKGDMVRAFEQYSELDAGKKGWYLTLPKDERVISDPSMMGSEAMVIATVIPPDPNNSTDCESVAGNGYLNAINLFTGTSPLYKAGGGYFRGYDPMEVSSGVYVTVGSVRIDGGMPTAPNVLCDENNCQVVAEPGTGDLVTREGAALDATPVNPHRLQWRSLR